MTKVPFSASERTKYATVHTKTGGKFPIKSEQSAKNAVKLINRAKPPLSSTQKAAVRREAAFFGVQSSKKPGK